MRVNKQQSMIINPAAVQISALAGQIFAEAEANHVETIAITETQWVAEITKMWEADVVAGIPDAPIVLKTWVTMGDELVREFHISADDQEVQENQAFVVGPDLMMFPGDDSLGAGLDNIINCRCSAIYRLEDTLRGDDFLEGPPRATPSGPPLEE